MSYVIQRCLTAHRDELGPSLLLVPSLLFQLLYCIVVQILVVCYIMRTYLLTTIPNTTFHLKNVVLEIE